MGSRAERLLHTRQAPLSSPYPLELLRSQLQTCEEASALHLYNRCFQSLSNYRGEGEPARPSSEGF